MTKMYLVTLIVCDFHTKWGKTDTLSFFQTWRLQVFIFEILIVVGLLGEKFTFLNSLGASKLSRSLRIFVYINVVLVINFPEQFKLCF